MKKNWIFVAAFSVTLVGCSDDDDNTTVGTTTDNHDHDHELVIPTTYTSTNYASNAETEGVVMDELSALVSACNSAEENAHGETPVADFTIGSTIASVTVDDYKALAEDWALELVKAANSADSFMIPGSEGPADGQEGGLADSRLLDENGLEIEQMLDKGMYGAALYNHAAAVIEAGNLTTGDIDKLVEIFGTDASWDAGSAGAAAKYAVRRSDNTAETGFFYAMKTNLLTAKAAIEAGEEHDADRDAALAAYLMNWEKSNFATVINYCYGARKKIQEASSPMTMAEVGSALHSYAEGVGFAHGFKGVSNKKITDAQIDSILEKLLAEAGETPESYRFLSEAQLMTNFGEIISDIQAIYEFTDEEVEFFYDNNPVPGN